METERNLETDAAISALRFLMEIVYANEFAGNEAAFIDLMSEIQRATRERVTSAEPFADADAKVEAQARIAAHLERFGNAVLARLALGRSR